MSIRCINLHYQIADKVLLNEINCEFQAGKVTAIVGQNGAGKTTLLKCLSKALEPSKGEVVFCERSMAKWSFADLAQQRAVLSQSTSIQFSMTVKQLIQLGLQSRSHLSQSQIDFILAELFKYFDLGTYIERDILSLSGGERQRAQLARVMAQIWPVEGVIDSAAEMQHSDTSIENTKKPFSGKWLLLDEWNNNLDLQHQQHVMQHLQCFAKQGLGIVMVLHDLNIVAKLADQVVMLKEGVCLATGKTSELLNPELIQEALQLEIELLEYSGKKFPVFVK